MQAETVLKRETKLDPSLKLLFSVDASLLQHLVNGTFILIETTVFV